MHEGVEMNRADNIKKSLGIASVIMMSSVLLSRVFGLLREVVLASQGGTSAEVDVYVASFLIPDFVNHLLASGALSLVFIPLFQKYLAHNDREHAWRLFSNVFTTGTVVIIVLLTLAMSFTEPILSVLGKNIDNPARPELMAKTARMTRIILPAQLFFFWGALFMAVQYAQKQFIFAALAPLIYNVGIIVGGVFFYRLVGIEAFSWGVLTGAFAGSVCVQLIGARRVGMRLRMFIDFRDRDLLRYFLLSLPFIVGIGMTYANELLFRFFASYVREGTGAIASLNYALRIMMIPVGLFGQAFAAASFPFISQLAAENKISEMNRIANGIIIRIGVVLIPVCGVMAALSEYVVRCIYQWGRFDTMSTSLTAPLLSLLLIGAVANAAYFIVQRNYYAFHNTVFPMIVSTSVVVFFIPLFWAAARMFGVRGIGLAMSSSLLLQFILLFTIWSSRHSNMSGYWKVWRIYGAVFGCTVCGMVVCMLAARSVRSVMAGLDSRVTAIIILLFVGAPVCGAILVVVQRAKIYPALSVLAEALTRKKKWGGEERSTELP
jgi:putative peptidoglycan lipid II flippase